MNKKQQNVFDQLYFGYANEFDDVSPGNGYAVLNILFGVLNKIDSCLLDANKRLVSAAKILANKSTQGILQEKLITILVVDAYLQEVKRNSPSHCKLMAPNIGHQTPRICNAVASAVKSPKTKGSGRLQEVSEPSRLAIIFRLRSLLHKMISMISGGKSDA